MKLEVDSKLAPVVIFVYNRPEHTKRLLQSLALNSEVKESSVYIFCDGPKKAEHIESMNQTRECVRQYAPAHAEIVISEKNKGLANSIIDGITRLVNQYGKVIVLEDDLVLQPSTLRYLNQALKVYEHNEKVMHISAYMFPVRKKLPDLFFYREVTCWGWATWKRAWDHFEPDAALLLKKLKASGQEFEFNVRGTMFFSHMLSEQAEGRLDSWAIRWYTSMFFAGGLALHPGQSFVKNEGFDGTGVHCSVSDIFDVQARDQQFTHFPKLAVESKQAIRAMMKYRMLHFSEHPSGLLKRFVKRLKAEVKCRL